MNADGHEFHHCYFICSRMKFKLIAVVAFLGLCSAQEQVLVELPEVGDANFIKDLIEQKLLEVHGAMGSQASLSIKDLASLFRFKRSQTERKSCNLCKVIKVSSKMEGIRNLITDGLAMEWSRTKDNWYLLVYPEFLEQIRAKITTFDVAIDDVQKVIDDQATKAKTRPKIRMAGHNMTWDDYHPLADIESYMIYLAKKYQPMVTMESIGKSYEGREMKILKVCKSGTCGQKPAIWIDGGIHAREWISPSSVTFIIKELIENQDANGSELLDKLDWYFLPVFNPDGYEYTHEDTSQRLWRKSR